MDERTETKAPKEASALSLPLAIIVAGVLIAGAIYLSRGGTPAAALAPEQPDAGPLTVQYRPVDDTDHLLGNPDAPMVLIEYSDLECPFCKTFHATMRTMMDEFGKDGRLAVVYRHFPLVQLHPKAVREAEAVECVNELSNRTATWNFINKIFEVTPANNRLEESVLLAEAERLGVARTALLSCLDSGRHTATVNAQLEEAIEAGGRGTPFSLLILKDELGESKIQALAQRAALIGAPDVITVDSTKRVVIVSGALPPDFMRGVFTTILN